MIVPGPRQAAKIAAEFHRLSLEISACGTQAAALRKQRDALEEQLFAFAKKNGDGPQRTVSLAAGDLRFALAIAQKPGSVSYKAELLKHITAADLQQIVDEQPVKEDLAFAAFPK